MFRVINTLTKLNVSRTTSAMMRAQHSTSLTSCSITSNAPKAFSNKMARRRESKIVDDFHRTQREENPTLINTQRRSAYEQTVVDYSNSQPALSGRTDFDPKEAPYWEHPFEALTKSAREVVDIYSRLKPNEVIFTNLPTEDVPELRDAVAIQSFLQSEVGKDTEVLSVQYYNSLATEATASRTSAIQVTLGSKQQAMRVQSALRKRWFGDTLLKTRTQADARHEDFSSRTVIVQGLPRYYNADQIIDFFAKDQGALVGIELPMENIKLRKIRQELESRKESKSELEKAIALKEAQTIIEESLRVDPEYQSTVKQALGEERFKQLDLGANLAGKELLEALQNEKTVSVLSLIANLQAEGKTALEAKLLLLDLKAKSVSTSQVASEMTEISEETLRAEITKNKEGMAEVMTYLTKSQAQLDAKISGSDPLDKLLQLGKRELSIAYDNLIQLLSAREQQIEDTLAKQVEHFGLTERVLQTGKNFAKELEDVENVSGTGQLPDATRPESVIGVGQQITNIINSKNLTAEQKVSQMLTRAINPFAPHNFSDQMLESTPGSEWTLQKYPSIPDPRIPRSLQHKNPRYTQFFPEVKERIDQIVQEARDNFQTPFDELYHKQKSVIQNVIDAEKALQDKIKSLANPAASEQIDFEKLSPAQRLQMREILDQFESPFQLSERRRKEQQIDSKFNKLVKPSDQAGTYRFDYSETQDLEKFVQMGKLTAQNAAMVKQLMTEVYEENKGYAFLTFSHSDEARIFLMSHKYTYLKNYPVEVMLKSRIDHSVLDLKFFLQKCHNDAQTVKEIEAVRKAREELRKFEKELDTNLPDRKKLQEFQSFAKSLIQNDQHNAFNRSKLNLLRNDLEEKRLDRSISEFEKANPGVDLTALYDSQSAEKARKALHKKAFANYKRFTFLKHGVKSGTEVAEMDAPKLSSAKQRLRDNDPFNFPALNQQVSTILTKEVCFPTLKDMGDMIKTPGRRVAGYSQQEYLEAFFGRDMARRVQTEAITDPNFKEQLSYKEKYPINYFSKLPEVMEKIKAYEKLGYQFDYKQFPELRPKDRQIAEFFKSKTEHEMQEIGNYLQGVNPLDPNDPQVVKLRMIGEQLVKDGTFKSIDEYLNSDQAFTYDGRRLNELSDNIDAYIENEKKRASIYTEDWYDTMQRQQKRPNIEDAETHLYAQHGDQFEKNNQPSEVTGHTSESEQEFVDPADVAKGIAKVYDPKTGQAKYMPETKDKATEATSQPQDEGQPEKEGEEEEGTGYKKRVPVHYRSERDREHAKAVAASKPDKDSYWNVIVDSMISDGASSDDEYKKYVRTPKEEQHPDARKDGDHYRHLFKGSPDVEAAEKSRELKALFKEVGEALDSGKQVGSWTKEKLEKAKKQVADSKKMEAMYAQELDKIYGGDGKGKRIRKLDKNELHLEERSVDEYDQILASKPFEKDGTSAILNSLIEDDQEDLATELIGHPDVELTDPENITMREMSKIIKRELAATSTGPKDLARKLRRFEETGEGQEVLLKYLPEEKIKQLLDADRKGKRLNEYWSEDTDSEEMELRTQRSLQRSAKGRRYTESGDTIPADQESKEALSGLKLDINSIYEQSVYPKAEKQEAQEKPLSSVVIGDLADVEKFYGLDGKGYGVEKKEGEVRLVRGPGADQMPEFLEKLERNRTKILDSKERLKREGERLIKEEIAKPISEMFEPEKEEDKPFEFQLDAIEDKTLDLGDSTEPEIEYDRTMYRDVKEVAGRGETQIGRIKRAGQNMLNRKKQLGMIEQGDMGENLMNSYHPQFEDDLENLADMNRELSRKTKEKNNLKAEEDAAAAEELGEWYRRTVKENQLAGEAEETFGKSTGGKHLSDFIEGAKADATDGEDVYREYQEMAQRRLERQQEAAASKVDLDADDVAPGMPGFESFFDSQAQGAHPFDRITNSHTDSESQAHMDALAEEEREERLQRRELLGRLYGGELTPRQYDLLTGNFKEEDLKMTRVRDRFNQEFLSKKDQIRLIEETFEKMRRQKVISGEWKESESQAKLLALIEETQSQMPSPKNMLKLEKNYHNYMRELIKTDNPERMLEKEYYFDETAGLSLQSHVQKLRAEFPNALVQTRRDREGFAIVKVSHEREYKYNLSELLNFDPEQSEANIYESMEGILKSMGSEVVDFDNADPEVVKKTIRSMFSGQEMTNDIDSATKMKLKELTRARMVGRYQHDPDGFVQAFTELTKNAKFVDGSYQPIPKLFNPIDEDVNAAFQESVKEIFEDRHRMREEFMDQLDARINKHMNLTARKPQDFIKQRVSEARAYDLKKFSVANDVANLEDEVQSLTPKQEEADFDRESFSKLKEELRQRKAAKESLLAGNMPQFKAYLRF